MSNIYRTNFERIKESYQHIFEALERAFRKFDIDYYLIGAQSRDVWTNHLNLDKRITRDIDYSVFINDRESWNNLTDYLVNMEHFKRDVKEPYRFYFNGIVDLIPFGGIEQNGEVVLDNPRTELSVYGCKEVMEEAVIIEGNFKVITLAGLCIMKLIAYDENPGQRTKDFDDYLFIVGNYHEIAGEQLFQGYYDDLIDGDFELQIASARMLGRHMTPILNRNALLKAKIKYILHRKLRHFNDGEIDQMYKVRDRNDDLVLRLKLISETIKGIDDPNNPAQKTH